MYSKVWPCVTSCLCEGVGKYIYIYTYIYIHLYKLTCWNNIYIYIYIYIYVCMYVCMYVCISWPIVIKGYTNIPFLIATTPKCRGGYNSSSCIAPLTLDPYQIMLSLKQGGIKNHFLTLWYNSTWDWTQVSWCTISFSGTPLDTPMCTQT